MKKIFNPFWLTLFSIVGCILLLFLPSKGVAAYPERPIQLIIPNVAGAQMDITGRILAEEMEKYIGVKIIPYNKPGAGTVLGTDAALRSKKDGYTILFTSAASFVYAPATNPDVVRYDPIKDAEPLGLYFFFPHTITVRSDGPWKNFNEFIDYSKKNPNKIRISTIGVGSTPHFIIEMIQSLTGGKFTHVPFEGGESTITALLGNHVEATCEALSKVKPHMDAGKLRSILITSKMPSYPDIPTTTELGYKQALPASWFAMFAPAGIPDEAKKVLVPAIEKAVKNTKKRVDQMGNIVVYKTPEEMKKMIQEELKLAMEVAVKMGLRKK
ncbi:MAG: tripartite tricarboxylate transporter substrate binding protein [Syntrophorhabdaceae bacterium]|nr:tripartite tricarboxylate transporter substrate binding protein [Syntrophorhabdaceae bacterium]